MHATQLQFRLLGPFEVRAGDRLLEVSASKHRILLAAMLLQVDRPLPVEYLADAIWGKAQPEHPRRAVQLYVTRLRQIIGDPETEGPISTSVSGYQLDVHPDQVDAWRFREHLDLAARMAEEHDLEAEAAALADALALWRGEPLTGVPSDLLQREVVPRLREQWLRAMDRRLEVELARDRHGNLVGELFTLTAQYPLHEPFWVQLMTALHRSGRRSDALNAFHTARRHLDIELGVDPGPELHRLYAAALAGGSRTKGLSSDLQPVPRQLPADLPSFVGRAAELSRLDSLLDEPGDLASTMRVCLIAGMAGIGKTALAVHWARRVVDYFPDGQLWVNLRGFSPGQVVTAGQALTRFLRALDVQDADIPLELEDRMGMYRSLMDGRRMLVVLDNANDAEQVCALMPAAPGCLVLVTSRSQLSGLVATEAARQIVLGLLSQPEAGRLLANRLGADRVETQAPATENIVRSCAGLPLALAIVGARAASRPDFDLADLAAELCTARGSLDAFALPDPAVEVRAVFSWSYQELTEPAARLFRLLGLHPGPDAALPAIASLAGLSLASARAHLAELCNTHLVDEHEPGRYACHDLLRTYAAELSRELDSAAERHEAQLRMFDHYLLTAHTGSLLLQSWDQVPLEPPRPLVTVEDFPDHRQALSWFTAEHQVLLAMVQHAAETRFSAYSQQLACTLSEYLYRRGHWHDWAHTLRTALDTVTILTEGPTQARLHRGLIRAYARMGQLDAAVIHGDLALELAQRLDDTLGLAKAHGVLGILSEVQGRLAAALEHDLQALELFQAAGDRREEGRALNAVGWSYACLNDPSTALDYCERALRVLTEIDDRQGMAATWDSLGYVHYRLGDHRQAVTCHRHAIRLFRDLGDRYKEAECLAHLGNAYHAEADADAAHTAWRSALTIFVELGHPDAEELRRKLAHPRTPERSPDPAAAGPKATRVAPRHSQPRGSPTR